MTVHTINRYKAQGLGGKGTEGTLEGLIQSGIDGSEVTAWDMLALPAEEMISMEELEKRIREGKTEKWADPDYVLTAREKKEARQIIKEYYKEEYNRFAMDEEARKKAYQITMLENKTSIGAGIMTGILKAVPFHEKLIEGMDQLYRETEKLTGMEGGCTLSETMQAVEAQYPAAAKASEITASVGCYALGAELVGSLPIAGKVAKTAGARAGALAGKLGAKAALQKGIEAGVTRIAADQIADTAVHIIPGIISDIGEGKEPQEIGVNALKAEAGDLAVNEGSEAVLNIAQAAVKKVLGAIEGGSGSVIHNDVLDSPRTGSALKVDDVSPIYEINAKTGRPQIVKEFPATAQAHGFNDIVDNYAGYVTKTPLNNATLYQLDGSLNGVVGRFEWIIQDGSVTHRMFIQNGTMNGVSIKP